MTNSWQLGQGVLIGLIVILIGLVVAGPWLTTQAARLLRRIRCGCFGAASGTPAG